jgi:DNA repair photolyase
VKNLKLTMDRSQLVGISETSDPVYHLDLFDRLYDANIIITKSLITEEFIEKLLVNKDKIILHLTVTGMAGTRIEPHVQPKEVTHTWFKKLLDGGFPVEQTVLRIDPCIATDKGIKTAMDVVELFSDTGVKRVRFSSLDLYKHVKTRFEEEDIKLPYNTFHAPKKDIEKLYLSLKKVCDKYGMSLETCAEDLDDKTAMVGCVSQKDIDILGLTDKIKLIGSSDQRKGCLCPQNKKELTRCKPSQCTNGCLYCFWRDSVKKNENN